MVIKSSIMNNWKPWVKESSYDKLMADRATGKLPEMESAKQLVRIIKNEYQPKMKILDVGCNVGHYLTSIRKFNTDLSYVGVDFSERYIQKARKIFQKDRFARFEVKDVFQPIFPENPFDIVFSCNVLLHLPDFRKPIENILDSTKNICIIRTLLGERTTIVKNIDKNEFDDKGNPTEYIFQNTWDSDYFTGYIKKMGFNVELISDEYNPESIQRDYDKEHTGQGTEILSGKQIDSNIIFNWKWIKATRIN
jgi:SAM-dependent methyltransferase